MCVDITFKKSTSIKESQFTTFFKSWEYLASKKSRNKSDF